MDIDKVINNTTCKISLKGRLDTLTSPQLEEALKDVGEEITQIEFDLEDLDYVSSAGLRVFLNAQKQMMNKDGIVLKNVNEEIMEIFEITGFSQILRFE